MVMGVLSSFQGARDFIVGEPELGFANHTHGRLARVHSHMAWAASE